MIKWNNNRDNTITIEIRSCYGSELVYPACKRSLAFCDIAKTKTLPARVLRELKAIGYSFEVIRVQSEIEKILNN